MQTYITELQQLSIKIKKISEELENKKFKEPFTKLSDSANDIGLSWSGSFLGYHSRTYYLNFEQPQAIFNKEWGINRSQGNWKIYIEDFVIDEIYRKAGNPKLEYQEQLSKSAENLFEKSKKEIKSILVNVYEIKKDPFLQELEKEIDELKILYAQDYANSFIPKQNMTRDSIASSEGLQFPPHIKVISQIFGITHPIICCANLNDVIESLISHLSRITQIKKNNTPDQFDLKRIFIGHGNSRVWLELRIFLSGLELEWEEFNRIPTAGIAIKERLEQMLNSASFAFLIMTAEDEKKDGSKIARMNVVHEIGLFQGKLGFEKAIILLEEGCEEFSNIHGLGQIRFPKGRIGAIFEDIRKILRREKILIKG